jgi:CRISPR/Cas system-associated protein Cas7 (RAMP superfamily)
MIRLKIKYTALSPISHNSDEALSNITSFRRQCIKNKDEVLEIPVVTGNSVRGILRRVGADMIINDLGMTKEELNVNLYHKFYTGGSLTKGTDEAKVNLKRSIREFLPNLSVFGTAMDDFILKGKLICGFLYPVSKQTETFTGIESTQDVYELLSTEFYTRRDDFEGESKETNQMLYETEVLIAGSELSQDIILDTDKEIEIGFFCKTLKKFSEKPFIGGVSRAGHGKVEMDINFSEYQKYIDKYDEFIEQRRVEIIEFVKTI